MKKLLVLMLVLGMASVASATLTVVQPSPPDLSVDIGGVLDGDMYLVISSDGMLSNYALTSLAPDISMYFGTSADFGGLGTPAGYTGQVWALAASADPYPISGVVMTVVGENIGDTVTIGWFDEAYNEGIIGQVVLVIPEPMTIALLGLGSLFLLRRRK